MSEYRLQGFAIRNPAALAIVDPAGRHWSRGEMVGLANRFSRRLREAGLRRGDVLAILAPNCAEYLVAYLAAEQIGLYVVPINWHLGAGEIQYILDDSGASALVVHERLGKTALSVLPQLRKPPKACVSFGEIPGFRSLTDFLRDGDDASLSDPEQGRVLGYTSATTGKPKGVLLPLEDAARCLDLGIERRLALGTRLEEHVHLCSSMLYHGAPLETVAVALHMGHAVVLVDIMLPETFLKLVEKYRVTLAYVVPAMFTRLLNLSDETKKRYSTASLVKIMHGAAPCPVEVKRRMMEWLGPILWESYAATEGGGTVASPQDWLKYPGTVGKPIPDTKLKIVGDDGEELPPGAVGTIYMTRYYGDRFKYLGDPEKTRACHRGEYFTVGDVGYVNEEGFLFICDRKIDMINVSGMKVYSAELENVLSAHPEIVDCAVFGVPDGQTGEAVMAVIQPAANAPEGRLLKQEILRFMGERLSFAKAPRHIDIVAELPRSDTGKLQKRRLRELYLERLAGAAASRSASTR